MGLSWPGILCLLLIAPPGATLDPLDNEPCNGTHSLLCPSDVSTHCLPLTQRCNFKADCSSGQDEYSCGYSCDFDSKWDYEDRACSTWQMPKASDGRVGFNMTSGVWASGLPNTVGGGPLVDYSTGTKEGHYALYLNRDHDFETTAELISPWYGSSGPQCQLSFSINMFGTSVGVCKLFLHKSQGGVVRELWSAYDTKGTRWLTFNITVGRIKSPFRFEFRVTRGVGDEGHFALDSIFPTNCDPDLSVKYTCSLKEFRCGTETCIPRSRMCDLQPDCVDGEDEVDPLCDKLPAMAQCNFEDGTCGWKNHSSLGESGWTYHKGPTVSDGTGPPFDHTLGNLSGHYMYMEVSGMGPGDRAVLVSPVFNPPPRATYNHSSPYNGSCQLKFFYHMYGVNVQKLIINIHEVIPGCGRCAQKFNRYWTMQRHSNHGLNEWMRGNVVLPPLRYKYVIMFEGSRGIRFRGDIAIDDISLSPECFGLGIEPGAHGDTVTEILNESVRFQFTTCAHTGPRGPTQQQCDAAYKTMEKVKVKVMPANHRWAGAQVWTVPETNTFSITALGACGGAGVRNTKNAKGAYAHSLFNLTEGDHIYMLIGQQGESACSRTNLMKNSTKDICRHWGLNSTSDDVGDRNIIGGGGGGGGGTFIFKRDVQTGEPIPLIIAGGGGGKSFNLGSDAVRSKGGMSDAGPGTNADTAHQGPGGGGGWQGTSLSIQSGHSLLKGATGGAPCPDATRQRNWETSGGYGGGGGACTAGGGGGGYTGGNASLTDNPEHNGQGGSAYISPEGMEPRIEPGVQEGDGEVEIAYLLDCPCQFMCIYQDYEKKDFICYCAPNTVLAEDGLSCIDHEAMKRKHNTTRNVVNSDAEPPIGALIAAVTGGVVFVVALVVIIFCLVQKYRNKKQLKMLRLERLSYPDNQLDRLRLAATGGGGHGMTEYNPNYDFGGSKCSLQDLREIQRDSLTLIRALGQGAFGEVYQGYLANVTRESCDLPVAIKTLPALCTDQAEMDFLMEAMIMSKFNHPNIVRFIGVCFEKHPRFIVLELLEGGDLKTFLRESRPKPDNPSRVTMVDLVRLSLDVAKGCQYLEENHFIHRDIAARNCLLTTKSAGRIAKIADFGMARDIYRADYYRKGGKAMLPVKWMPPEAFLDGIFTSKTDVWSFGILLWEVFSLGYMPYPGRGNQEVMQLVTAGGRLEPPQKCPPPLYHIMTMCWHGISERRPTFAVIIHRLQLALQHPEVIHCPLPVFQRPTPMDQDNAVMRPRDPERMVLTVEPPVKRMEPDSPLSTDQLIRPHSPDIIIIKRGPDKRPNLSSSAESLDKLLHEKDSLQCVSERDDGDYKQPSMKTSQPSWFKDYSSPNQDWPPNFGSSGEDSGQSSLGSCASRSSFSPSGTSSSFAQRQPAKPPTTTASLQCRRQDNCSTDSLGKKAVYENMTSPSGKTDQQPPLQGGRDSHAGLTAGSPSAADLDAGSSEAEPGDSGVVVHLKGGSSLRQDKSGASWL